MKSSQPKRKPILSSSFWWLMIGLFIGIGSIVIGALATFFIIFPDDYKAQLIIAPKSFDQERIFSYKIYIKNDHSAENAIMQLENLGQFKGDINQLDDWISHNELPTVKKESIKVITVGRMDCQFCLGLYPYINLMDQKYGKEVQVIGVLYGKYPDELDRTKIKSYLDDNLISFPVAIDNTGDFVKSLNIDFVPETFIIDKDNTVLFEQRGLGYFDRIDEVLKILREREKQLNAEER